MEKRVITVFLLTALLLSILIGCNTTAPEAEPTEVPVAQATEIAIEEENVAAVPTAEPAETPTPEPTEEPTPTPEPTDTPTPSPTPEPTPTPEPILCFDEAFKLLTPGVKDKIDLVAEHPSSLPDNGKVEIRLADGTVVGSGKIKQHKKNTINIALPAGSPVRTTLYLYVEGTDYPIHTKDVAVLDREYEQVQGNYERGDLMVTFTFDCAYGEVHTDWLLDTLKAYNVHATFFMTGEWMSNHGKWIERMIAEGHEIGNHSLSHPRLKGLSEAEIIKQINTPIERMLKDHGYRIHLFRAPYGWSNPKANTISRYLGCEVIKWGQTSKDATESWKSDQIIKLLLKETQPGDIILCHNGARELRRYLVPVLKEFTARGYTFGTVSEIMGWTWDDTFADRDARIAAGESFDFE